LYDSIVSDDPFQTRRIKCLEEYNRGYKTKNIPMMFGEDFSFERA